MTQGFAVIRMKTIFRMLGVCVCLCVHVYESLGKSVHIFLCLCVCERFCVSVLVRSVSHAALLGSPQCA